jgi:hypothetical protein
LGSVVVVIVVTGAFFSSSSGIRQQHMMRMLSINVSAQASTSGTSSTNLPFLSTCKWGIAPEGWSTRACLMAVEERGVVAFPYWSVCVMKSGRGASLEVAATFGVLRCPGERRSEESRVKGEGGHDEGVEASVRGVASSNPFSEESNCVVSTLRLFDFDRRRGFLFSLLSAEFLVDILERGPSGWMRSRRPRELTGVRDPVTSRSSTSGLLVDTLDLPVVLVLRSFSTRTFPVSTQTKTNIKIQNRRNLMYNRVGDRGTVSKRTRYTSYGQHGGPQGLQTPSLSQSQTINENLNACI